MTAHPLQLNGRPCVHAAGAPAVPLSLREAALLAWLLVEGPTPRARLAGLLWPGSTEAQARANLRQTLARLRRGAGALIAEADGVLRLAPGVTASPGPLLEGLDFDTLPEFAQWLAARRDEQGRQRERELAARGRQCLEAGDTAGALAAADELLAAQPENETAWRLRMEALYQQGDRAAAIAAWDACRLALRQAFGVAPSAATNALGQLLLASDAAPAGPQALPASLPSALRRPPRLVGRDALCQALARHLALGGSALLAAPGGMGKSRVLERAVTAPQATLWLGVRPGDAVVPGSLIGQLLTQALARFTPALDPATAADVAHWAPGSDDGAGLQSELAHRRAIDALGRALDACHARGLRLVVVDDLHLADAASLALLHRLLGRWLSAAGDGGGAAPQLLLGARTLELPPAGQALRDTLAGHAMGRVFELSPLDGDGVAELVAGLDLPAAAQAWGPDGRQALAQALHAAVGGSPAHVLEALRHLVMDGLASWRPGQPLPVPDSLVETLRQRLARLPADALQLAQLAAVAQSDFDIGLAETTLGRTALALAPPLAALEAAWVFDGERFSHDLVAEAVRSLLPRALVGPLHRRVAEHLIARGDADAARIAHHLCAAGATGEAAPWLMAAASAACGRWQLAEAADGFAAAARGFEAAGQPAQALAAWCQALRCWVELRRFEPAQQALAAAWPLAHSAPDQARLRAREVQLLFHNRRAGEAVAVARPLAQALAGLTGPTAQLDAEELVYALRSVCLAVQGGLPACDVLALCERAQPVAARRGGELLASFELARAGTLLWAGQPGQAAQALEATWQALPAHCDPYLRRSVGNQLMRVRQALGDLAGALELGRLLLSPQPGAEDPSFEADVLSLLAMMQVACGQPAQGLASMALLHERLRAAGEPMRELYASTLALTCLALGQTEAARRWLDEHTQPPGRPGYLMVDYPALLARTRLARACGEPLAPWLQQLQALGPLPGGGELHRQVALAGWQPQPRAQLLVLLDALRERGQAGLVRSVEMAAARAALAEGDRTAAAGHARAALALAACVEAWSDEAASVWLCAHAVLTTCGCTDEAQAALAAGQAWVAQAAPVDEAARHAWRHGNPVHRALLKAQPITA